jgi:hypothetical protein
MRIRRSLDTSGPVIAETIADVPAATTIRIAHMITVAYAWAGGDLPLTLSEQVGGDTTSITALGSYLSAVMVA